ncbi:MAG: hypothetical protein LBC56_00535 [Oscillospiraceae bacterium]|jgi:hypothetical protein|nr:hypothetical protein [Oscillospiraceae bacterium]
MIASLVNLVISGINALLKPLNGIEIPEWLGGGTIGIEIPKIQELSLDSFMEKTPKLAAGGFTNGITIAGEDGAEAVSSF